MQVSELFKQSNTILLDGGMGTMLQAAGLQLGARPEELNITDPQLIEGIHAQYAAAGSRIINANTFGASAHKLAGSAYSLEEIIAAGIANCKRACAPHGALAALDVGPLGELLEPNGTLAFEDAVEEYARIVRAGAAAGADLIFFETFTDLYELKAALLAARENSSLPILASMSFEAGGRTFTGCTVESFGVTARGLGASAVGINCSLGPKEIFPMAKRLTEAVPGNFPVFVKPNAGLPRADGSGYDITPQLFEMCIRDRYHPIYEAMGGVPAIREVQFSIIQNRGCFGGCNFCAIQLHQGRRVTSRSADSIVAEAERMTHEPDFKGYIHDIGGPTANFRFPSCREQMLRGMCNGGKHCLAPTTCSHMIVDHSDYLKILRRVRELPGVKKVFIRSGIRFDYLMADPDDTFFKELVEYHVSGQLKVAPEHCAPNTLAYMGKPPIQTFNKFKDKFYELSKKAGKKQYLVPYLMSSHPGSTLKDAVYLAEYLYKNHMRPEQVQDFYPTPGTVSTCMFYTGLDPYTLKPVFVEKTPEGKALQRALLQYYEPRNAEKVVKALQLTHREDLIPLLVPAVGRRAVQRTARRAESAEVTIHNDGTYTVHPNQKGRSTGKNARAAAPAGRQPSPGARFAPNSAPGHKPKNNQQKENATWKTGKKKK